MSYSFSLLFVILFNFRANGGECEVVVGTILFEIDMDSIFNAMELSISFSSIDGSCFMIYIGPSKKVCDGIKYFNSGICQYFL